ncbi:circadian clock-controlled protein daywake-like [Cylas formicarius]|uniref:circadian clock-controlled protein daywake-like n=1 Tax=Cylas formicarius TaxID=197179 RepID=UPI002958BC46|nr:circadian clock-controlled protein daywake-like [Cylas formicarius]
MRFVSIIFVFLVYRIRCGAFADELPSFLHVCHRNDPNLIPCLIAAVEEIRPFLVKGVPEYNLPSLEPLHMKDFFAEETAGMTIKVTEVSAWGCSDYFVRGIEANMDTNQFVVDVDLPKLRIEAHYHVDGKLLMVQVRGDGDIEANITDVKARAELQGELYDKDGEKYMKYTDVKLKVSIGGGSVRLANLFNGDQVLLAMINDVVNKNLDLFLKELMPIIQKSLEGVVMNTGNAITDAFSYKQLFPQ